MKTTTGTPAKFRQHFMNTTSHYQQSLADGGLNLTQDFSRTYMVRPTLSDFTADVEICARKELSRGELAYFNLYYRSLAVVVLIQAEVNEADGDDCFEAHVESFPANSRAAVLSLDNRVREKLGMAFHRDGIAPHAQYLQAVDVRAEKYKRELEERGIDPKFAALMLSARWNSKSVKFVPASAVSL